MADKLEIPKSLIDSINSLDLDAIIAQASAMPLPHHPPIRHPYPLRSRLAVAGRVKRLRAKSKLSMKNFAALFPVMPKQVMHWERGEKYPLPVFLRRLAELEAELV